jgi:fructose-bisphosphate aldolase, class I
MSTLGKQVHLNRIFSHPSGRILAVAADHMINYRGGIPEGLRRIQDTIRQIAQGRPSSITLNKGVAMRCMGEFAGRIPLIIQQTALTPDRPGLADHAEVEEAVALGADAIAVAILVKCEGDLDNLKRLATTVREAERYGLPVVTHIYPIAMTNGVAAVSTAPEDVFYAVRAGLEMGADVIKAPYTGDPETFGDIVASTPVPLVTAGGPRCESIEEVVAMMRDVVRSGAAGSTVGRNVWGFPNIPETIRQLKAALGIAD